MPALPEPAGFAQVLGRLGRGMDAECVYVFEAHSAADGQVHASQRYEWNKAATNSRAF